MAGPGGVEAGRASVRVLPDLSKFLPALRAFIERVERQVVIQIPTKADTRGIQDDLERVRQQARATDAEIPLRPDSDGFTARAKADIKRAVAAIEAEIPLTADGERFRRELTVKIKALQAQVKQLEIEVPISPEEAATARAEIYAQITQLQALAKRNPIEVPVKVDSRGFNLAELAAMRAAFASIRIPDTNLLGISTLLGAASKAGLISALAISAAAAIPNLFALSASLTQIVGVLGLFPAAIGAAVGLIGALATGLRGFGTALSSMGDPAKFAEALKNLSPAAREAALAIKSLGPEFHNLRLDVQQALFTGVGASIKSLALTYLPVLREGLTKVATSAGQGFQWVTEAAKAPGVLQSVRTILDETSKSTSGLFKGIANLVPSFTTIGAVGAPALTKIAEGFSRVTARWGEYVQQAAASGELQQFINNGIRAFTDLGNAIYQTGRILSGIANAATAAGGSTLGALAEGLTKVANVVQGADFQQGLTGFFSGILDGARALGDKALPALGAALARIGPVLGEMARSLGPILGDALARILPVIAQVITALGPTFTSVLNALLPVVASVVEKLGPVFVTVLQILADAITRLAPFLEQMVTWFSELSPVIQIVIVALIAFLPTIISIVGALAGFISSISTIVAALSAVSGPVLIVIGVVALLVAAFIALYTFSQPVRDAVAGLIAKFQEFWGAIQPILAEFWAVIQENLPAIQQMFNQVGEVVAAVMTSIGDIISVVVTAIKAVWAEWGDTIMGVVRAVFPAILGIINGVLGVIKGIFAAFSALLRGDWSSLWEAVKGILQSAMSVVTSIFSGAWNALTSIVSSVWGRIVGAVGDGIGSVISTVASLPGRIVGAIGDLGGMLYSKGRELVQGLIDGIRSMFGAVASAASNIAGAVGDFFPGSPIKKGPLVSWNNGGAGKRLIADGVVDGMLEQALAVSSAAGDLAGRISSSLGPMGTAPASSFAGGRSVNVYGNVGWDPEEVARQLEIRDRDAAALANLVGAF